MFFFAFSGGLRFLCVFVACSLRCFACLFVFAFSLRYLCVWGDRGSERLWESWKCKTPSRRCCCILCILFVFVLHFLCVFCCISLRFLCVWCAGGLERLWEGWQCKQLRRRCMFFAFSLAFFVFFLRVLHFLCVFFASGAREARRGSGQVGNANKLRRHCMLFVHFLCVFWVFFA